MTAIVFPKALRAMRKFRAREEFGDAATKARNMVQTRQQRLLEVDNWAEDRLARGKRLLLLSDLGNSLLARHKQQVVPRQ